MLRPSYNEVIDGFGYTQTDPISGTVTASDSVWGATVDVLAEVMTDKGFVHMFTGGHILTVSGGAKGLIGGLMPFSDEDRETYSLSCSGYIGALCAPLLGIASLETTHTAGTPQSAPLLSWLPMSYVHSDTVGTSFSGQAFFRPNTNPSGYTNIANVVGLACGVVIPNGTGGDFSCEFDLSVSCTRWNDPDVNIRTPIV